jgi:hypothetical protein
MAKKAMGVKLVLTASFGTLARQHKAWNSNFRIMFDDGTSAGIADRDHRTSKIFRSPELNKALRDAMREFADNVESGVWNPKP